jgi:sulfate permease, SulP family
VVIVTFLLVVFRDLTEGIVVGFALGGLVFIRRMSEATEVQAHQADEDLTGQGDGVIVYRMRGAYFFGAAALLGSVLNRIADNPKAFVLDFSEVPLIDSSGARSVALLGRKLARNGGHLYLTGTSAAVRRVLLSQDVHEPDVSYLPDVSEALAVARQAKGSAA